MSSKHDLQINWNTLVTYDTTSPTALRWAVDCFSGRGYKRKHIAVGDVAGSLNSTEGYSQIHYKRCMFRVSHIIWKLHGNTLEADFVIDHRDGDPSNNRIDNLRAISALHNAQNKKMQHNNTSGVVGVCKLKFTNPNGVDYFYYKAEWRNNLISSYKTFSVHRLGEEEAFRQACEHRAKMIVEMNEQGAGYTERHGK